MSELLPCPFCGGEPTIRKRMDEDIWSHNIVEWTSVNCDECGIYFDWPPGADPDAMAQWNTRVPAPPVEAKSEVGGMSERDPVFDPKHGDIVRSCYDTIGERHVIRSDACGVTYYRVRPKGKTVKGYCLPGVWTKWCRAHRVEIIQRGA